MKRLLLVFVVALVAAAECGTTDDGWRVCCGEGKHPEGNGNFICGWDDESGYYCYQEVDCVPNQD